MKRRVDSLREASGPGTCQATAARNPWIRYWSSSCSTFVWRATSWRSMRSPPLVGTFGFRVDRAFGPAELRRASFDGRRGAAWRPFSSPVNLAHDDVDAADDGG